MSRIVTVFWSKMLFSNASTLLASHFWEQGRGVTHSIVAFLTLSSVSELSGIESL